MSILKTALFKPVAQGSIDQGVSLQKPLDMGLQKRANWCWAASSISVASYIGKMVVEDQCELVKSVTGCKLCKSVLCNALGDVKVALGKQGIVVSELAKVPNFKDISSEIEGDRPILCNMREDPSNLDSVTHCVVMVKCGKASQTVSFLDPISEREIGELGFWEARSSWEMSTIEDNFVRLFFLEA